MKTLVSILLVVCVSAAAAEVERKVEGQKVVSERTPKARLEFDPAFKYAGGQSFELYGVANAEQHFFVDAAPDGRIRRVYWLQFEGFMPNNQETYTYDSPQRVNIGGLEFFVDVWAAADDGKPDRPGSDGDHAKKLLEGKGLKLPDEMLMVRLVHLTDATKRDELMIIYAEELAPLGVTAAEVNKGGAKESRWPELSKLIVERAQQHMKIRRFSVVP